jgi:hypothetical protein
MSIFFDEDKALTPKSNESWSKGPRTDISENYAAVAKAFSMTELSTSEMNNLTEEYGNVVQLLHENGNSNFTNPVDIESIMGGSQYQENKELGVVGYRQVGEVGNLVETQANFWKHIEKVKKANPELNQKLIEAGLDTYDNMQKKISTKAHDAWREYAEISSRATTSGKIVGGFGGMALTSFKDPYMQLGVIASFGYSIPETIGAAAIRVAYMEAIIGGVAETMIQLKAQPYRKELGFEDAGLKTGIRNVFMVAGASAALSPLLMGVIKAFGKGIDVGKKHLLKLPTEDLQKINQAMGDANPKYKNKDLDNYKIPEKDNPFPDNATGRTEHRERLDATVKSVNESTALDLPPAKNPIDPNNLKPPINVKPGELIDIFDAKGNKVNVPIIKKSSSGNSIKVKMPDGSERVISLDPKSGAFQNIRNPNYTIRSSGLNAQGKTVSQLSKQEINTIRNKLIERKAELEKSGQTNQGAYADTLQDLNSIDFNVPKIATETNSPGINKANFNRNETTLAQDIEGAKNFDVPTEATYRNQALYAEESMFGDGTSLAIRSEAGAGAAAKTVPTDKPLVKTQDLVSKSQVTDAPPPSTVLATAQSKPPLLTRGETNKVVGDINSIGFPLYHKTDNFNEIYKTLSQKVDTVKKELQPIATKYNGDLKARIKEKASLKEKLALKPTMTVQNVSDVLGVRISVDNITAAKVLFSELDKKYKLIGRDDFLDDVGRTLIHNTNYRRIHLQALTKDGFSFELQISLKELDPLIDINHVGYKKITYQKDQYSASEMQDLIKKQTISENNLKNKYFEIKDKEFSRSNPTNDVDIPFVVGTRLDESTGEIVPLMTTARETFEQDAKAMTMLKRLENCV